MYHLSGLRDDAIETNRYLAEQKGLTMDNTVQTRDFVPISKSYAGLVFRNRITDAVKYYSYQGSVTVSASVVNDTMRISVSYTGIGISPDVKDRIWDELFIGG